MERLPFDCWTNKSPIDLGRAVFVPPNVLLPDGVRDARDYWTDNSGCSPEESEEIANVFVSDARLYYETCDQPDKAAEWGPSDERTRCVVIQVTREKSWPERWW